MKPYLTTAEAAAALGVSTEAVCSLIRRGHLSAIEPIGSGRGYLVPAAEVALRARKKRGKKLPRGGRPKKIPENLP